MRRTLVFAATIVALAVLAIRVWPVADPDAEPVAEAAVAPRPTIALAFDTYLSDDICAGPAMLEMMRHPGWEIEVSEREWDDVVDDRPDELLARAHITASFALWIDGDLPQQLELTGEEKTDLLLALQGSCAEVAEGNGFTGDYIELAYGRGAPAFRLPSRSRAAIDTIAVLDRVRARYVAGRLGVADTLRLALPRLGITVAGAKVTDRGDDAVDPLSALERVDVLDWAMELPERARGAHVVSGTLEVAGARRKIAVDLDAFAALESSWRNRVFSYLASRAERLR